jgi:thioredoxin
MKSFKRHVMISPAIIVGLLYAISCAKPEASGADKAVEKTPASAVGAISGAEELTALIDSSGNRLLMFDLYADWCMPCRVLSPMIESIAAEMGTRVSIYKINIDKNPTIADVFQVSGIPFVVMIKNKVVVQSFVGVQPRDAYVRAIINHGEEIPAPERDRPDGDLVDGVRVIKLTTATSPGNLYVYRGEEVKLLIEKVEFPYSVHLPGFNVSKSATLGADLVLEFKAGDVGVFPMFCNGNCPSGDGQQFARIVVMEYAAEDVKAIYKSLNAKKARELIAARAPFILDVRTPNEFYEGSIPGATLIPVQQLADRFVEIGAQKGRPVLVYCRSGNRSIVAAQILIRNGFTQVYNLQSGIKGWMQEGYETVR